MRQLIMTGISKSYAATRALDGMSLAISSGEVHALMGENGAGKSTTIRILAGLERPDAGEMRLDGTALRLAGPQAATAAGFRFLHQELQVVPGLSVAENMHLARTCPTRFGLVDWRALRRAATEALLRLGAGRIDPRVRMGDLGPGDQMLVRIAATLIADDTDKPWLYVLDEPTASLSHAEAEQLFAAIAVLKAQGAGVVYVSHRMDEVLRLADRVTVLRDGRHISTRPRAETGRQALIRDMTGRDLSDLFPPRQEDMPGQVVLGVKRLAAAPLAGVSFDLRAGEVLGLAGLSGSGRAALLKALIGAIPRTGEVRLDGRALRAKPDAAWAAGVAYVPRERRAEGVMLGDAVSRTVSLPHLSQLSQSGMLDHRRIADRVAIAAREVRLKSSGPEQPVAELSGGNQQKVLFARALVGQPKLLLLDEPTRGVDVGAKFDIYTLIRDMAARGVAVIIASSDLPELIGLCDRIAILRGGAIADWVPAAGLTEAGLLQAIYGAEAA